MKAPRVLIVDDFDDTREMLHMILADAGFAVVSASSGSEAVALAKSCEPQAVLMDLYMPDMDGVEATRLIKTDPRLRDVPVVAYTARPDTAESEGGLFAAVCPKPCAPATLLAMVRALTA
jgi:two-component system cell cycle response regulator